MKDNGGGSASAVRTLKIIPACDDGESLCPDNACSKGGLCKGATSAVPPPPNRPPLLALITSEALPSTVNLKKGGVYTACNGGAVPTPDKPCDLGVVATDEEDGDLGAKARLRARTLALPPPRAMHACAARCGPQRTMRAP